jgi:hypothetical protein
VISSASRLRNCEDRRVPAPGRGLTEPRQRLSERAFTADDSDGAMRPVGARIRGLTHRARWRE